MKNVVAVAGAGRSAIMNRLARGGVLTFGTYIAGLALTYLSQLLFARLIGSTSYGYYAYALAWMTVWPMSRRWNSTCRSGNWFPNTAPPGNGAARAACCATRNAAARLPDAPSFLPVASF